MSTELILQSVSRYIHLTDDEQAYFVSLLHPKTIKRKQFMLVYGQICKYSTFVTSGCLRGFTVDENGFEHVLNFGPPGWWIADMYSLLSGKPGILNIEAIEDTEALTLSKTDQDLLYAKIPQFERFFRIITENSLVAYQQRLIDNLSLPAEDRFHNFCKRYPSLINALPKKQIAAYIGVTPEFFSRLQHKLVKMDRNAPIKR